MKSGVAELLLELRNYNDILENLEVTFYIVTGIDGVISNVRDKLGLVAADTVTKNSRSIFLLFSKSTSGRYSLFDNSFFAYS